MQGVATALREARAAADAKVGNVEKALKRSKDAEDALAKDLAAARTEAHTLKHALKVPSAWWICCVRMCTWTQSSWSHGMLMVAWHDDVCSCQ
jgi:hypothetical protein